MNRRRKLQALVGAPALIGFVLVSRLFGVLGAAAYLLLMLLLYGGWEVLGWGAEPEQPRIEVRRSFWVGLLLPAGLALLFVAERVVSDADEQLWWWRGLALACLAAAAGWRGHQLARSKGNQRQVETRLAIATGGVLAALGLYALSTDAGLAWMGLEAEAAERTGGALGALWVALLVVSGSALFAMEGAYRLMPIEEAIELRRVSAAAGTGLSLALSLVFVVSLAFVTNEREQRWDLSYFKTTRPSETSVRLVERLDEPGRVVLLYPEVSEVLEQLRPYFAELDAASEALSVEVKDHALAPELVREHRVRGNGFVLLLRGEGEGQQAESFEIGEDLEAARSRLRTLDGRFQERFAQLTTRPRDLHVTTGHRERSTDVSSGDPAPTRLSELSAALRRSNIQKRDLGLAQGLANQVPEDARAVAVIGPREPFLPEEAQSLLQYVEGGGRLLVFVDPDADHELAPLLAGLGLSLREGVLHSTQSYVRRTRTEADRQVIYSNHYSAHPTVTLANRFRARVASIFDGAGALERAESEAQLAGVEVTFPIRTAAGFWLDQDGNHAQDQGEPSDPRFQLMAAVTVPNVEGEEGRAVVVADGDFITDAWIGNQGNAFVLMDALNWLVGEDEVFGPTQTEEDVPIQHTRDEDEAWFYATSFGAPLPLLLAGIWMTRRSRRGGREPAPQKRPAPTPPAPPEAAAAAKDEEEEE